MQRIFAQSDQIDLVNHSVILGMEERNHLRNVLRMKKGEEVWVSDGSTKEYHCVIEEYPEDGVCLHIQYVQEPEYELPGRIVLFQGLPKADKLELVIQKAVELGASQVVIVQTKRCVARLDEEKAKKKLPHWRKIALSAAEQSRRLKVPEIGPVLSMQEALTLAGKLDMLLIPYELERGMEKTRQILREISPGQSIGIFIGPEGGFEESEIAMAKAAGACPISLGRRILRTETAGLAILSVLVFLLER